MIGLFIVGTDTGVGKTTIACGLLRLASRQRLRLVPCKPVETGCEPDPPDATRLAAAAALDLTARDVCALAFRAPVAPSVAARLEGTAIDRHQLLAHARGLAERGDALLVEGAGGLLSPLGPGLTVADLAEHFALPILLVSADRLGTINHTALALQEIRRRGLPLAGLALCATAPVAGPDAPFNAAEIALQTGVRALGTLRHCAAGDPETLADAVAADIDLAPLLAGRLSAGGAPPSPRLRG